jgi:hypothetical protein
MRDDRPRAVGPVGLLDRDGLISAAELSDYLQVPVGTLRQWRYLGVGPRALRLRGQVRYDPAEVRRWLAEDCDGDR